MFFPDGGELSIAGLDTAVDGGVNIIALFGQSGGRMGMGFFKPVIVPDPPPGEIGNYIFFPLVAIALWFALPRQSNALDGFHLLMGCHTHPHQGFR